MADTHRARAERRATRVAHMALTSPVGAHQSPSLVVNAATGTDTQYQEGSSKPTTEQADARSATPSLVRASTSTSRAGPEMPYGRRTLAMAIELLRY
ncbi:hypothetical protein D1007_17109 [Hordeum vulgare]|nr:hypothetical protein D1007_17109 [Hordeum vulgare]